VFLVGVLLLMFSVNLGGPALWDPDEGRHAEIAREALVTRNWLTPTLDFEPYHQKPMPFYWLVTESFALLGQNETAARLPSALAAAWTVLATALWARRYAGALEGLLAGCILATAGGFVATGRFVVLDMSFTCWVSSAALYGGAWLLEGMMARWLVWPLWAALGLAVLLKGAAALVLAGVPIVAFALLERR
jgi:4-amino-4-deoxy-L-arabinose transferase-like glycosyltransferase